MISEAPLLLAFIASLSHMVGALVFVRMRRIPERLRYAILAVSAGFLISLTFLDLLPPAYTNPPWGPFMVLAGFFVVLLLQFLLNPTMVHTHHVEEHTSWVTDVGHVHHLTRTGRWMVPVFIGLTVHSFFDGVLLGSAFAFRADLGIKAFWAIFVHGFPVSLTLTALLLTLGVRYGFALLAAVLLGFTTILGLLFIEIMTAWAVIGLGLAAGSLLYVTTVEFIPIIYHSPGRFNVILTLLGLFAGVLFV